MDTSSFTARADLGFAWSVKDSFLQYIRSMRDGDISWAAGAAVTSTGEFFFPLVDVRRIEHRTVASFQGAVTFTAHHGLLAVSILQPRIVLEQDSAELFIGADGAEESIAVIELPPPIADGDVTMWMKCAVSLRGAGPELFGGTYGDGEPLASLTIRVPTRSLTHNPQEVQAR